MRILFTREPNISEASVLPSAEPEEPLPTFSFPSGTAPATLADGSGTSRDHVWRNVDPSGWEIPDAPFQRIHDDQTKVQAQFHHLEYIAQGAS